MKRKSQGTQDRNILEMVRGLLLSGVAFQEIFKKYKAGQLCFSHIGNWADDKGNSLLYNLKEQCHFLFREMGKGALHKHEWLLDLAIGSIFHEAMKLRENIYQMEVYRPKYLQYRSRVGRSAYEKDYLQQFERIISKAEQGLQDSIEETHSLFRDAMEQLVDFLKENAKNKFLVRFLLENQPLLRKVYGSRRVKVILDGMFKKGFLEAYQEVGGSCLQSEHYDDASLYFLKALNIDPYHRHLQFLLNFSLGMKAYYNNDYSKALSHFSKLLHLRLKGKVKKDHLKKLEEVCRRISSEWEEEKRLRGARSAGLLADRIRKCYD